jgi:hypothetical protein
VRGVENVVRPGNLRPEPGGAELLRPEPALRFADLIPRAAALLRTRRAQLSLLDSRTAADFALSASSCAPDCGPRGASRRSLPPGLAALASTSATIHLIRQNP